MNFSSWEMHRKLAQIKVYHRLFCSVSKEASLKVAFKSSSCKKIFPKYVYHWYNLPQWMFFILWDNWKQYLLHKFIITQRHGATAMLLHSLKQVFWKKFAFYIIYLHNNITMLLTPKVQNKDSTFKSSQKKLLMFQIFLTKWDF